MSDIQRIDPKEAFHMGEIHAVREHAGRLKEVWHEEKCIFCGKWHGYDRLKFPRGKAHCGNESCAEFYRRHRIHQALKDDELANRVIVNIREQHKRAQKIVVYT
jgi:hypothetical protein